MGSSTGSTTKIARSELSLGLQIFEWPGALAAVSSHSSRFVPAFAVWDLDAFVFWDLNAYRCALLIITKSNPKSTCHVYIHIQIHLQNRRPLRPP